MSWTILIGLVTVLGFLSAVAFLRRADLKSMRRSVEDRDRLLRQGSREAQLQHPVIDLTRCMGCSTCVAVCPETGVLDIVHGQAVVVNGAGCMGIAACERDCPVGAIEVTLSNIENRRDIPAITEELEAIGTPGLFLAGEVTAQALIKVAIENGTGVAAEVARRRDMGGALQGNPELLDLLIVGAGPAGLACALEAKRHGLRFQVVDQESDWGGTVAKYPRQKLVLLEPVELPIHGVLAQKSYSKEEIMELWLGIAAQEQLPLLAQHTFEGLEQDADGLFLVRCSGRILQTRNVCLAIGRGGVPRKLEVPGEELPNVSHALVDAASFHNRRLLVVGGGDTAVETALGLATQPGNEVTLSYRKEAFFRLRTRNLEKLQSAVEQGQLKLALSSQVLCIHRDRVELSIQDPGGEVRNQVLRNDYVFVMIGGVAPIPILESAGVSFDPALRPPARAIEEKGSGAGRALWGVLGCTAIAIAIALWHWDYYSLSRSERPAHGKHVYLRPGWGWGLGFGIISLGLVITNLAYLLRRSPRFKLAFGTLRSWMTVHVVTGVAAVLFGFLHAAMAPRDTVGGHSLWMLAGLLVTGAIGRYFYAYVPRAANGRELALEEIRVKASVLPKNWTTDGSAFGQAAYAEVLNKINASQWESSFWGRLCALLGDQRSLRRSLGILRIRGMQENVPVSQINETLQLVRDAHRESLAAAHFEDLRALASAWRYLHRWGAILMVVLVTLHVGHALFYGSYFEGTAR